MTSTSRLSRCLAVWLVATAFVGALAAALLPDVARRLPATFDLLLVRVAEWALLGCGTWLWLVTTAVVLEAVRGAHGSPGRRMPGTPPHLRRILLLACGAAVLTTLTGTARADDIHLPTTMATHLARGLDRLTLPGPVLTAARASGHDCVVVQPGDSLWSIAARRLGRGASPQAITAEWQQIYALNREIIGSDPELIEPGQRLALPTAGVRHG